MLINWQRNNKDGIAVNSSLKLVRYLSIVHTWAIFFLRHLANMSSMFPFEHQLTPALSPIWGPRPKPRRPEEVVYSLNDSCSHFTQRLFPPKLPRQLYIHHHSYLLYITFKQAFTFFYYMIKSLFHFFGSSWQASCPRSLVSDTLLSNSISPLKFCCTTASQW
jgi:hypothetical protein